MFELNDKEKQLMFIIPEIKYIHKWMIIFMVSFLFFLYILILLCQKIKKINAFVSFL